ncbi:hypothetical protein [Acinetobacter sp.]|uniref:hypothetical protein n=1 Tax=Acinetobacter sp. TaxID=472 RepID=UPI003D092E19
MSMTIDLEINNVHPDMDMWTIVTYLSTVLQERTQGRVFPNLVETDFANPIKLSKALRIRPAMPGGEWNNA